MKKPQPVFTDVELKIILEELESKSWEGEKGFMERKSILKKLRTYFV